LPGIAAKTAEKLWETLNSVPNEKRERFGSWLAEGKVSAKSQRAWEQLGHTLDEIAPGFTLGTIGEGGLVPPSMMIHIIMEAVYDDYLQSKYANYEQRREDLASLENFARGFGDTVEFLSQLCLPQTRNTPLRRKKKLSA